MLTRNCLLLFLWILVEEGSVSSLRLPSSPPLGRSKTAREHTRSSAGPMRNGAAGFQRVKRGWVWNQFFVLEEYMGSDPQYVGKLHTDLDKGDSAVKYTLSGDGAGSIFTIDQTTGDIHALRSLDREEKPYYTLRAQAVDINTNRPLEPESEFVIKVQDINDNEPKFLEGPYTAIIVVLYVGLRRQKKKETLMSSKEDIRDNVIHYDDEGGGEEDTHAFDMGTLRNPKVVKENMFRRDVKPEMKRSPRPPVSQDSADIRDFINQRLKEHDVDNSAPPYDSLATYAYEGDGSVAESLSSIDSLAVDHEEDYDYLNDWGPRFKTLAGIFGEQPPSTLWGQ
uniref:Cadherin domain-containing protein n=1 Tax=Sphaeramia orbicularis TaxID=375764 RepID=A0A673CRN4_9TELE